MIVNSYAEFLTLSIGWQEYENIWAIIQGSGLWGLPFLSFFIKAISTIYRAPCEDLSSFLSELELRFFSMLFCLTVFCQPYLNLELIMPSSSSQKEYCEDPETLHQTTTFSFLNSSSRLHISLGWGLLNHLSTAFITAALKTVGREHDARSIMVSLDLAVIQDIHLLLETQSFVQQCFLPSLRKYARDTQDDTIHEEGETSIQSKLWIGDPYFMNQPGYYDYFNSLSHTIEERRVREDGEIETHTAYLSCTAWWSNPGGLQDQLITELKERAPGLSRYILAGDFNSFLKQFITQSLKSGYSSPLTQERTAHESSLFSWISHWAGHYGLAQESIVFYPFMAVLLEALPLIQALLLMAGIIFYPIFIVLTHYRIEAALRYLGLWSSIQLWSYLWALAGYLDNLLIDSLYPGLSLDFAGKILIDMVALLMYIVLPVASYWVIYCSFKKSCRAV